MGKLTFKNIVDAFPETENKSSHAPYASYLRKLYDVGFTEDLIPCLSFPKQTAQQVYNGNIGLSDAKNIFKALKYAAEKADLYISPTCSFVDNILTPDVMKMLKSYTTELLKPLYVQNVNAATKMIQNNDIPKDIAEIDVTDVSSEYDDKHDVHIIPTRQNTVQQQLRGLEQKYHALSEKTRFIESILLEIIKNNSLYPGVSELLFKQSFDQFR